MCMHVCMSAYVYTFVLYMRTHIRHASCSYVEMCTSTMYGYGYTCIGFLTEF